MKNGFTVYKSSPRRGQTGETVQQPRKQGKEDGQELTRPPKLAPFSVSVAVASGSHAITSKQ